MTTVSKYYKLECEVARLKEKSDKYDALGDIILQVNDLLNKNRELNSNNQALKYDRVDLINASKSDKQKLEKIEKAWNNREFSAEGEDFGEQFKQILNGNK